MSNIDTVYKPKALYFEEADALEYVRLDCPKVHRRIDETLTLILDMKSREPIGFKIKGFKNFHLRSSNSKKSTGGESFPRLITILEEVMTELGDKIFANKSLHEAYQVASEIAKKDGVFVSDLPNAA